MRLPGTALLLLLVLLCGGCDLLGDDDGSVATSGTVINRSTGEPISGMSVVMKVGSGGGGFGSWGGGYRIVASDRTDARGRYELNADLGDRNIATVYLNEEPYDPAYRTYNYSIVAGERQERTIPIFQTTVLRTRVDIREPLMEGDRYCLNLELIGACEDELQVLEVGDGRAKGNAYNRVRLSGTVGGEPIERVDSVYCPVGEVTRYTITY